jgi:hypothetical protein
MHSVCVQTLYAAMHEPDGVSGANALRREEPSLREQILEHESIGLLRDATACYDRAIQLESDQVTDTHVLMKCASVYVVVNTDCSELLSPCLDWTLPWGDEFYAGAGTALYCHHTGQWSPGQQVTKHTHPC